MENRYPITALTKEDSSMIKGVAIILVLLGHMWPYPFYAPFLRWGGGIGVSLFLIASGYGINESVRKGVDNYWSKRIKTVYIPYLFVAVLILLFFGCDGKGQLVCTLLGLDFCRNADKTMWYISYIFYWYLVYYVFFLLSGPIKNEKLRVAVKLAGLFAMAPICKLLCYDTVWHFDSSGFFYIWHFPIGAVLSELSKVKVKKSVNTIVWTAILVLCTARMLYVFPDFGPEVRFSVPIFFIAIIKLIRSRGFISKTLCLAGEYSYPIYLFEGVFVFRNRIDFFGWLPHPILTDAAAVAVTVILSVLFWERIYKKLLVKIPVEKLSIF